MDGGAGWTKEEVEGGRGLGRTLTRLVFHIDVLLLALILSFIMIFTVHGVALSSALSSGSKLVPGQLSL